LWQGYFLWFEAMGRLRRKLGLSLAVMVGVGNYNAEAGMLARWLGFGNLTGNVSNVSSLNTTAALVNHSAFGGPNAPGTHIGSGNAQLNLSGINGRLYGSGIGASLASLSITAAHMTAGNREDAAKLFEDDDVQLEEYSIPLRPESVVMYPVAMVPQDYKDDVTDCINGLRERLTKSERIVMPDDNYISNMEFAADVSKLSTVGKCKLPDDCTILANETVILTPGQKRMWTSQQMQATINGSLISLYDRLNERDNQDEAEQSLIALGNILRHERNGAYGWKFFVNLEYSRAYRYDINKDNIYNATLTVVYDETANKMLYTTLIHDSDALSPFQNEQGLPPCGIVPHCVYKFGGRTLSHNPLCANNGVWPFPENPDQPSDDAKDGALKLRVWKYVSVGIGSAAVIFGITATTLLCKAIRQYRRNKNEIQIEFIDDPVLTGSLLQE
jgi:hypothetical protein